MKACNKSFGATITHNEHSTVLVAGNLLRESAYRTLSCELKLKLFEEEIYMLD